MRRREATHHPGFGAPTSMSENGSGDFRYTPSGDAWLIVIVTGGRAIENASHSACVTNPQSTPGVLPYPHPKSPLDPGAAASTGAWVAWHVLPQSTVVTTQSELGVVLAPQENAPLPFTVHFPIDLYFMHLQGEGGSET